MAWIGVGAGAVAVSGALAAILYEGTGGRDTAEGASEGSGEPDAVPEAAEHRHEFSASYDGPVWITVEAPDATIRAVTIRWGPWQRDIVHDGPGPVTYHFTKDPGPTVPLTVTVDPGAEVDFGTGPLPQGAVDVNDDWVRASDDG